MAFVTPAPEHFTGLDTFANSVHATKLFIGGVSRHTSTKQMRDHFSKYGRVLDCVAMRQQDGRSRGFGYVTLDSLAAAKSCLAEAQVIDNRVVDMKLAIPEDVPSPAPVQKAPEVSIPQHQARPHASSANKMQRADAQMGTQPFILGLDAFLHDVPPQTMAPQPCSLATLESPKKAPLSQEATGALPKQLSKLQTLSALDRLQLFEEMAEKYPELADDALLLKAAQHLSSLEEQPKNIFDRLACVEIACGQTDYLLDADIDLSRPPPPLLPPPAAPGHCGGKYTDDDASTEAPSSSSSPNQVITHPDDMDDECAVASDLHCDLNTILSGLKDKVADVCIGDLPSVGSARHAFGECRRCNFFAKGRCDNGKDCTFCHFDHEQRNKSRQEKRERKSAWLAQQRQANCSAICESGQDVTVAATGRPERQTIILLDFLPASAPPSLPVPLSQPCAVSTQMHTDPQIGCHALDFSCPAPFMVNFADYSDDDSDEEADDVSCAGEATPTCQAAIVSHEETQDVLVGTKVTSEAEAGSITVSRDGCTWSREELLCVRTKMREAAASQKLSAPRCSFWRTMAALEEAE